jgi:phosphate transport system substrate-binding protein
VSMPADQPENSWLRRAGGSGILAIAAVACWLAVPPALAQAPAGPLAGAGESATPPSVDLSERKQLLIVGSTSMQPITDAVIEHLIKDYVMPEPITRFKGTQKGVKDYCSGIGAQYPDIAAASDRMGRGAFDTCVENKVLDTIEVSIGQSAVVAATKKGDPAFNITPRMVYYAAAEDIPVKGEFTANPYKSWKETNKAAPDLPIRLIIPGKGSGTRAFFNDNFMQGGCRHVKEIDEIFAAAERVPKCITLRDDGPVTEVPEPYEQKVLDALGASPPGTVAIIPWVTYLANRDKLEALPVDGVLPTHEAIADYAYPMATTLRYYFKRGHMRNDEGRGVVRGIREFMAETVKDDAFGEGGYFEKLGVIALEPEDRRKEKEIVRRLRRFEP